MTKFVFQGVHETICFGPASEGWKEGETPVNQIVFIGRNLSRTGLMEGFRSCIWVPLPDDWEEHFDKRTGQPYYVNTKTKQKSWERPIAGNAAVVCCGDLLLGCDEQGVLMCVCVCVLL